MTGSSIAGTAEPSSAAVAEGREKFDGQAVLKKYKRRLRVEIVGLCVLMAIVWGLLTLPIIFYFSPTPVVCSNVTADVLSLEINFIFLFFLFDIIG